MSDPADSAATAPVRLARFLAAGGLASRRACEDIIRAGRVTVNGQAVTTPACTVVPDRDQVLCDGRPVCPQRPLCLLLNKPVGYTCSARDDHAERLVYELVPKNLGRLFSVGRLDRDSEGLILLTNDGDLAQRLAHPSGGIRKVYHVEVRGRVDAETLGALRRGIVDDGEFLKPLAVTLHRLSRGRIGLAMTLQEGRKREVRRLCAAQGLAVLRLRRVAFGPLRLGSLPAGAWRDVSAAELEALRRAGDGPAEG